MIKSLPDIQSPEPYSIKPEKVTDVRTEETGDGGLILGVGAGIACLCVITLGIVLVIVLILFLKKKSPANPQVG
jgi:hypothetical protein